jgi:hypothetical protein
MSLRRRSARSNSKSAALSSDDENENEDEDYEHQQRDRLLTPSHPMTALKACRLCRGTFAEAVLQCRCNSIMMPLPMRLKISRT